MHLVYNSIGTREIGGSNAAKIQVLLASVWTDVTGVIAGDAGHNIITSPDHSPVTVDTGVLLPGNTYGFRGVDSTDPTLVSNIVYITIPGGSGPEVITGENGEFITGENTEVITGE